MPPELIGDVKEWLVPIGYIAGLLIVLISVMRGVRSMTRMSSTLATIESRFGALDEQFKAMWLTAEQIGSSRPTLIQELVAYETWDTSLLRGLMKTAKRRIHIMQTWFPEKEGDLDRWEFGHLDTLHVMVLMAHHDNPAVHERVRYRQDFPDQILSKDLRQAIKSNVDTCIRRLRNHFGECAKRTAAFDATIALYRTGMPFGPVYLIDDLLFLGFYPAHLNCNAAPMLRMSATGRTGSTFIAAMDAIRKHAEVVYATQSIGSEYGEVSSSADSAPSASTPAPTT